MPAIETDGPAYLAIADAIARDVAAGKLDRGARLPTHRDLARHLGVTVGTVSRGYAEAERRGLTVGEVGRGTFVRGSSASLDWSATPRPPRRGVAPVDLSLACPWVPPDGLEGKLLARTLRQLAKEPLDVLLTFDPATASALHRERAARWLRRLGHAVHADQVVVSNGAQHGIQVTLGTLLRPGDTLAAEELTYPGLRSVARTLGLRLRPIALDDEGLEPESLARACQDGAVRALYCVPTLQNPTAATMSIERRQAVAEVARRYDLTVVEDGVHLEHDPDRTPPLAHFAPERTVLLTTLCKWATFGLRVGFLAVPEDRVEPLRAGVRASIWNPAPLMVEIATRWLEDGTAERLGQHKLEELAARHELAREVLPASMLIQTAPRSLSLWISLPDSLRHDECVAQARQRGVLVAGADAFAVGRQVPHAVRVSLAAVPTRAELRRGLEVLREVLTAPSTPCTRIL